MRGIIKLLKGKKILIADANDSNRPVATAVLERYGVLVSEANTGATAVKMIRETHFDLVLIEIQLPELNGYEATEIIRSKLKSQIPIIALTAVTIDENIDDFHEAGFNDIIPKPYKVEEFFQKIHNALKRSQVIS